MAAITPMYDSSPRKLRSTSGSPAQRSAPGLSSHWKSRLLAGIVMACTTTTATPRPMAVCTFFEMAMKVHIPRKNASAMFSMNTERKNRLR